VQSFWSFWKVVIVDDIKRVGTRLGVYTGPAPPTMEQIMAQHQKNISQLQRLLKEDIPSKNNNDPKQKRAHPQMFPDAKKTMTAALPGKEASASSDKDTPATKIPSQAEEDKSFLDVGNALRAHYFRAIIAFKQKFAEKWKPARAYPPRGSILVGGLVELDSPKAWLVFDVKAAYDPKTKDFDTPSMNLRLRRIQMKTQKPLR
jgi:hypothetical protein